MSDTVKTRIQTRVTTQVEKTLEGLYVSLVYSGWQSLDVQDMLANAIANILIEEYDTKQQRLDRICAIAEQVINRISETSDRVDADDVDSQD